MSEKYNIVDGPALTQEPPIPWIKDISPFATEVRFCLNVGSDFYFVSYIPDHETKTLRLAKAEKTEEAK